MQSLLATAEFWISGIKSDVFRVRIHGQLGTIDWATTHGLADLKDSWLQLQTHMANAVEPWP